MSTEIDCAPLIEAAEQEIAAGLAACQLAVAHGGEIVCTESFGAADAQTRFGVASATKPIVASAVWLFIGDGSLDIARPVVDYVPEFGANGKEAVTVEQVLLMTCGFPNASMEYTDGADAARRVGQLAKWELEYEPGTQYVYHGGSAHWVLAEIIERLGGVDFRDFIEQRITTPLGLPRLLGVDRGDQTNIAQLALPRKDPSLDYSAAIEAGMPGGGGVMTAATLALFYQGLLHDPEGIWHPEVLADGIGNVRCTLHDPMMDMPANRTIGVVVGDGFGATWGKSPTAFGWPGMGGQVGFAEPATGVSFAFLQAGDTDQISTFVRAIKMTELALESVR